MLPTLNEKEENRLIEATTKTASLVDSGMTPDAALEKVASDFGLGSGAIRLVGQAYNNGQQLGRWRSGGSILEKMASFPLCNPEAVVGRRLPAEKTAADQISVDYARPPQPLPASKPMVKAAAAPVKAAPKPTPKPTPAQEKIAADENRRRANAAADSVRGCVADLVSYFRKAASDRVPFGDIEVAAAAYYGDAGVSLLDLVYRTGNLREKRGEARPLSSPIDRTSGPLAAVGRAIEMANLAASLRPQEKTAAAPTVPAEPPAAAGPWNNKAAALFGVEKRAFGFGTEVAAIAAGDILAHKATHGPGEDTDPFGDVTELDRELQAIREQSKRAIGYRRGLGAVKRAFLNAPVVGATVGSMLGRTVGSMPKTRDDLVDDAYADLDSPDHQNELRKIRSHAMLNGLLTDPDDPISGHDPAKVLSAFNDIAAATPRLADNVALLRPLLRKRLEGHTEPFETKEMLDIEKGLMQTRAAPPKANDGVDKSII
jgi:hypothetical protein